MLKTLSVEYDMALLDDVWGVSDFKSALFLARPLMQNSSAMSKNVSKFS